MKKILTLLFIGLISLSVVGCQTSNKDDEPTLNDDVSNEVVDDPNGGTYEDAVPQEVLDIENAIYEVMDEAPMHQATPISAENFEYMAFIPYDHNYEAYDLGSLIGSIAHSVVLIKVTGDGYDLDAIADEMVANADLDKWVCVVADKAEAAINGDYILFVMSDNATTDAMIEVFEGLDL